MAKIEGKPSTKEKADDVVEVQMIHARWKNFAWGVFGVGLGVFLAINMGSIGWVLAALVWGGTITNIKLFVQTFLSPPGKIVIGAEKMLLPSGLCAGEPQALPTSDLRHAYLLRRAIPWNTTGPVLVIETQRGVFEYERHWFPNEGDQRLVSAAVNRRLGRTA